jgi:hypothetical protein
LYDGEYGNVFLTPDDVKDKWLSILKDKLENHGKIEENVYQFDTAQLSKWGPQGGHAPISELLQDVVLPSFNLGAADRRPEAFDSIEWHKAKRKVIKILKQYGVAALRPVAYENVTEDMRVRGTLESNSGMPDFKRRNLPDVRAKAIHDAETGAWKDYPAIALFRTYNGKTRLVWMFPMSANLVEGSFFQPLQKAIMKSRLADEFFSPWKGFEAVRKLVTRTYNEGLQIAASDFTSTDAHFQRWTSLEVYDVIAPLFVKSAQLPLKESIEHMHNIPLVVGPRRQLVGSHGVSSGSNWTNFIETIFDMILGEYVRELTHGAVRALYAIGDDMAWVARKFRSTFREELDAIGASVGQVIKAEKTMAESDMVKTLQRLFQRGYRRADGLLRGVYSTIRALKSSIYPERFHNPKTWDSDMFCARQFMILENCVDHPLFEDFVRFVCKGNQHLVPFARKSSGQLEAIHRRAKLVPGLNPTYNQEKRDQSLANFQSIRLARGF